MPPLCSPAIAHTWQFLHTLACGVPSCIDGRIRLVVFHRCTRCEAVLELSGEQDPQTKRVRSLEAWLWPLLDAPVPVLTELGEEEQLVRPAKPYTVRRRDPEGGARCPTTA